MILVWTSSPDGSLTAPHGKGTVRVSPLIGGPDSRWFAFGIDGVVIPHKPGAGLASWPSLEEAKAACERSPARAKPGPKATGVKRYPLYITPEAMERLKLQARGLKLTASQALQRLLMALPEVKP